MQNGEGDMQRRELVVSARALAGVLGGRCARCFWVSYHLPMPGERPMPSVLTDIDRATKQAVREHVDRTGRLPDWYPMEVEVAGHVSEEKLDWRAYRAADT